MTPKIDYQLLGAALAEYEECGYTYVEVPWAVTQDVIRATLPAQYPALTMGVKPGSGMTIPSNWLMPFKKDSALVGSAEQGFLALNLPAGRYVGVTPCFRPEPVVDLLHQYMFMKIELFCKFESAEEITDGHIDRVMWEAEKVMGIIGDQGACGEYATNFRAVQTAEGYDLEVGGVEVGSYGKRSWCGQHWVYGTGLALPRFSVAKALSTVV